MIAQILQLNILIQNTDTISAVESSELHPLGQHHISNAGYSDQVL
jgi:hypothetical protein